MLHEPYFEILDKLLGDYTREIYGRELVGKVSLSQKGIALTLDGLETDGVLTSKKSGNMKFFRLNAAYVGIKDIILMAELSKKMRFFKKYPIIAELFKSDNRVVGLFGSYAKGTQKTDSDIDMFIIGERKGPDYIQQAKVYDLDISIKYFTLKEFNDLLRKKNPLVKEIVEYHVLLFNAETFIALLWENYYGLDRVVP